MNGTALALAVALLAVGLLGWLAYRRWGLGGTIAVVAAVLGALVAALVVPGRRRPVAAPPSSGAPEVGRVAQDAAERRATAARAEIAEAANDPDALAEQMRGQR